MLLSAAELDRKVTFQIQAEVRDPRLGTVKKDGWVPQAANVPAKVTEVLPTRGEQLSGTINMTLRPVRIVIRYRTDITAAMRVLYEGRTLEIVSGPRELGRRVGLEFYAQEYSTAGAGR